MKEASGLFAKSLHVHETPPWGLGWVRRPAGVAGQQDTLIWRNGGEEGE